MSNKKIADLLAKLLSEKGYDITWFRDGCFHALYSKDDYYYYISVECEENIKIEHDINMRSFNQDYKTCCEMFKMNYDKATTDINFLKEQVGALDSKPNILKMLEICEVPSDVIKAIEEKL